MRLIIFITLFFLISSQGQCQKCVIATRENIIYLGIANHLNVAVNGCLCKNIALSTDNGKIEPTDDLCSYFIYPDKIGGANINLISKITKKKIGSAYFRVRSIPAPVAMIAHQSGGDIRTNLLKVQIAIVAELQNFDLEFKYRIESYTTIILRNEKAVLVKHCNDARFPQDVKNAFNGLETNDKVIFSDISCRTVNNTVMTLQPIEFRIIE